ncbi:MAG TPA: LLM class F420-dependent oxidoreductase [Acidimicrobiaceae bacterium]|nr:LLM class F420-dependent oxidoreductase [Acidimicrobiaceae bacterium]HCV34007.1 LLM class F420-dependent oxidoreductase [Acidimicrobiaceae bacterium]|tara:strand:+ start:4982 stop:6007 length:1026 start_codon:yes stop_codon:yes gene_type:complete
MELGLSLGYWGAQPPTDLAKGVQEAERLGYSTVWTAESWGSDAFTPLAWLAAQTSNIRLGTGIVQMAARTPTATAMHAVTLDHLSNGRLILGLGVSGPQVVEGWYGRPSNRPLARTREYVEVLRRTFRREEHLSFDGEFYQHPYTGAGSNGLGKPLKVMVHPLRTELPIFIGAEGPRNVAQTAEIADGWLPLYYSPYRQEVYANQLVHAPNHFEVALNIAITETDDDGSDTLTSALAPIKASLGFYVGGMGAKGQNYHTKLMARMGFEEEALHVQELFLEGRRDEAIAAVPDEFADEISLVGTAARIRDRLAAFEDSPVTMLNVAPRSAEQLRRTAELLLE